MLSFPINLVATSFLIAKTSWQKLSRVALIAFRGQLFPHWVYLRGAEVGTSWEKGASPRCVSLHSLCDPKHSSLCGLQIPNYKISRIIPACSALAGPDTEEVLKAERDAVERDALSSGERAKEAGFERAVLH